MGGNRSPFSTMEEQWEVQYSRFFNFPSSSSTCPNLEPLPSRKLRSVGNWLSSASLATLQVITYPIADRKILVVSFQGKIREEHYICKLHFTWPQVSCLPECPIRGSRVVFASYRDCAAQLQKFAMRFSTSHDSKMFMNSIKESLKDSRNVWLPSCNDGSAASLSSELADFSSMNSRPGEELCHRNPITKHEALPLFPSIGKDLTFPCANDSMLSPYHESKYSKPLSSFTALLLDSCIESEQGINAAEVPKVPANVNIMSEMVKDMSDHSFQDMLQKVETAIYELGGDLAL